MGPISLFNDVLGPVMRGPSSSHTAGSFHIAKIVAGLLGGRPSRARFAFDPRGSYARVFREQGVDRGFAMGLLGWPLTDARFFDVLDLVPGEGLEIGFDVRPLPHATHPNTVDVALARGDAHLQATARSTGGGAVEIVAVDGWVVRLTGETWEALVEAPAPARDTVTCALTADGAGAGEVVVVERDDRVLLHARRRAALGEDSRAAMAAAGGRLREAPPIAFVKRGPGLFDSAAEMIALAEQRGVSLGHVALAHEASLLGLDESAIVAEMARRLDVMRASVADGLGEREPSMQLLQPTARRVYQAEATGRLAIGGLHTRAAARALAAMEVNSSMGVVCAAPTGGSAGVLPAVMVTLEEAGLKSCSATPGLARLKPCPTDVVSPGPPTDCPTPGPVGQGVSPAGQGFSLAWDLATTLPLFAAAAIGVVVASRATFAAEVAGCQVEIGAAGAMAAAAVVEAAGGTARQAADAAAIAFQNTMGSVCDLVQGVVEIPCHTRNAVAASSAFVCADLVLGGYVNPIPLDETIDAVFAVGRMMPSELRCTARGGLAVTPTALEMKRGRE